MNNTIKLTLPHPPSVNATWWTDKQTGRRHLTKKAKEFRKQVKRIVLVNNADLKLTADLVYTAKIYPPADHRGRDLDNHFKNTWDALEKAGVFLNDSQFRKIKEVDFMEPSDNPRVEVEITELSHFLPHEDDET